jgi:hypothetical protein
MTRSWLGLAGLIVAVLALAAWVYWRQPAEHTVAPALSKIEPAHVQLIRYEYGADSEVVLERRGPHWRIAAPFDARADSFQVERLLATVQARASARYPASDLARFGLERPVARLALGDVSFSFGSINTTTREQYVLTREGVHAVPIAYVRLPRSAEAFIARELFGPEESPVRFQLPGFSMTLEDGRWTLRPQVTETGADERTAWAERWRLATGAQAALYDGAASGEPMAVGLKDGRTIEIGILRREPELVLVRHDERVQYFFSAEAGRRLLPPPGDRR